MDVGSGTVGTFGSGCCPGLGDHSLITMAVPDPLEHSGMGVTDGVRPGVVPPEPLEHSVLVAPQDEGDVSVAGVAKLDPIEHSGVVRRTETMSVCLSRDTGWHATIGPSGMVPTVPSSSAILVDPGGRTALPGDGGPNLGPDVREDDLVLGAAVPLPAENIDQATLSPVEVRVSTCDVTTDGKIAAGLVNWNTEGYILDQYETFNGMPVYYGGDLCDSEDSDWDYPYAIASAAYVEDYNFDVPEGMDLMVHRHRWNPDNSDIRHNWQMGMTPVCQTMSCVTRDEWDTIDDDSLTEAFAADGQNMDEFYRRVVSSDEEDCVDSDDGSVADLEVDTSDEEDFGDSDDGSVADLERDTWAEACSSAFQNAVGAFPPEAADVRPVVVFSNRLFSGEELADTIVSVRGDVPMSPVLQATDKGVAMIPPVADRPVQWMVSRSVGWDV